MDPLTMQKRIQYMKTKMENAMDSAIWEYAPKNEILELMAMVEQLIQGNHESKEDVPDFVP